MIEYGIIDHRSESAQCNNCKTNNFQNEKEEYYTPNEIRKDKVYYLLVGNMRVKLCRSCAQSVKQCMSDIEKSERARQRKLLKFQDLIR